MSTLHARDPFLQQLPSFSADAMSSRLVARGPVRWLRMGRPAFRPLAVSWIAEGSSEPSSAMVALVGIAVSSGGQLRWAIAAGISASPLALSVPRPHSKA